MEKGKIITIGGPSGVGKSSVLKELAKIYEFQGERKYDSIVDEAKKQGIIGGYEIQKHFNKLEKAAHENMIDGNMPKVLDMHYAINDADLTYALGGTPSEDELNSSYKRSTGTEAIKVLAENSKLYAICLTADTGKLIERAEKRAKCKGVKSEGLRAPRSIDPYHVETEIQNETDKFLEFYDVARKTNPNVNVMHIDTNNKSPKEIAYIIKEKLTK